MTVFFVGAGPGDPELLTIKADRLVRNAKVCIYAGSLVAPEIIQTLPADCEAHDSAKMDLAEILRVIRHAHDRGLDVVRLHTGEPALYGAIGEQMRELNKLGIAYEQVPGISAWQAAAATIKTELTAPEVSQSVVLTRTSGRTPLPASQELKAFAPTRATLCLYLSTHKIAEVALELQADYGAECPVAVVYHASWPDEQVVQGTLADVAEKVEEAGFTKTALILVGHALAGCARDSKLYDPSFSHEYRKSK